jgi:hypothetical protein
MSRRRDSTIAPDSPLAPLARLSAQVAEIERLWSSKRAEHHDADHLGGDLLGFFRTTQKRQGKLAAIAAAWEKLVPEFLCAHCALESFARGQLTVIVDSSPHLYELRQLLLSGIEAQLILACKSAGLRKIALKPGRWYEEKEAGRALKFD